MRYSHNIKTGNVNISPVGKHPKWQANVFSFPESDVGVTGGLPWRLKEKWYNRRNDGKRSAAHVFEFCSCHRLQSRIILPNGGQRCGRLGSELGFSRILTGGIPSGLKLLTLIVIWYAKINRRMAVMTFSLLNLYESLSDIAIAARFSKDRRSFPSRHYRGSYPFCSCFAWFRDL